MFELFKTFFQIGFFTIGGGYAMIPLIEQKVVDEKHWVDHDELLDLIAVAQSCPDDLVIGADTVVVYDGAILGKPADEADAARMLRTLSGKTHEVFTGVCLIRAGKAETFYARTQVTFYPLSEPEIEAYVATGEPMDKAGAYAIQGGAGAFVEAIDGEFDNVVGFPTEEVKEMLQEFGM